MSDVLRVNPIACDGHGLCAEIVPELIELDEWGYPIVSGKPVPAASRSTRGTPSQRARRSRSSS